MQHLFEFIDGKTAVVINGVVYFTTDHRSGRGKVGRIYSEVVDGRAVIAFSHPGYEVHLSPLTSVDAIGDVGRIDNDELKSSSQRFRKLSWPRWTTWQRYWDQPRIALHLVDDRLVMHSGADDKTESFSGDGTMAGQEELVIEQNGNWLQEVPSFDPDAPKQFVLAIQHLNVPPQMQGPSTRVVKLSDPVMHAGKHLFFSDQDMYEMVSTLL